MIATADDEIFLRSWSKRLLVRLGPWGLGGEAWGGGLGGKRMAQVGKCKLESGKRVG